MKRYIIFCLALISVNCAVSSAQEATPPTLEGKVQSIDERLAKSEKRTAALEKFKQYFNITGFLQSEYDWIDNGIDGNSTSTSSFYIRRARFSITGDLYKGKAGKLNYRIYFDLARIQNPNPNPILDMWVRYQPIKEFGVQLGQFKNPITFEASISPAMYDFIDFSYAVSNLAKMSTNDVAGVNATARDMGFMFLGGFIHRKDYSIINYHIGVVNGNGINIKDNNKSKDVFGRLTIKTSKDFALTAYYQWGEANLSHLTLAQYAEYRWEGNPKYVTMHRWGGGFSYDGEKAFARGEYIAGLTGELASEGVYVQAGKKFYMPNNAGMLWTGGMVDYFCRNCGDYLHRNTRNAMVDMRYSVCVGYTPFKYLRVQLAYSLEHRINNIFGNNRPFRNGVKLMVTGAF